MDHASFLCGVPAFEDLIRQTLERGTPDLEAVSGATVTSNAFVEALRDAMVKTGLI